MRGIIMSNYRELTNFNEEINMNEDIYTTYNGKYLVLNEYFYKNQ